MYDGTDRIAEWGRSGTFGAGGRLWDLGLEKRSCEDVISPGFFWGFPGFSLDSLSGTGGIFQNDGAL